MCVRVSGLVRFVYNGCATYYSANFVAESLKHSE